MHATGATAPPLLIVSSVAAFATGIAACATTSPTVVATYAPEPPPAPVAVVVVNDRPQPNEEAVGQVSPVSAPGKPEARGSVEAWRSRVVAAAERSIGRRHIRGDRSDCAGFVRSVFRTAGLSLPMGVSSRGSASEGLAKAIRGRLHLKPLPGDLAFFHDTYDRNHDGELGDPFSHVAIVESASPNGSVTLIHFGGHGVARLELDVTRPSVHVDGYGKVNDYLRLRKAGDPPGTRYLAGELLAGFGTPMPQADPTARSASARRAPTRRPVPPSSEPL